MEEKFEEKFERLMKENLYLKQVNIMGPMGPMEQEEVLKRAEALWKEVMEFFGETIGAEFKDE